jgi:hypothetical protein
LKKRRPERIIYSFSALFRRREKLQTMKQQEATVIEGLGQSREFLKKAYNAALIPSMLPF